MARTRVLICYSREDDRWRAALREQLTPFAGERGPLDVWDDTAIEAGVEWRSKIAEALATAKVGVLFVSPASLASEFITREEIPALLEAAVTRGARLLCVYARPSLVQRLEYEFTDPATGERLRRLLTDFQGPSVPERPLSSLSEHEAGALLTRVAEAVLAVAEGRDTASSPGRPRPVTDPRGYLELLQDETCTLAMPTPSYTFFIAHAGTDTDRARELYNLLHPAVPCFLDVVDLEPGQAWDTALREAQGASRATIVLISQRASRHSHYRDAEIADAIAFWRANEQTHGVIPIYLDGLPTNPTKVPYGLTNIQPLDVKALGLAGVAAELRRLASKHDGAATVTAPASENHLRRLYQQRAEARAGGDDARLTALETEIIAIKREQRAAGQLQVGDVLGDGRYELLEHRGKGGFATVWKAWDGTLQRWVAVKVLHADKAQDRSLQRFVRGARQMAGLDHPGIVRVLDGHGVDGGWHYFVMEFIEGEDLDRAVRGRRVDAERGLAIVLDVADALQYTHDRKLVHRDVTPSNILLDRAGRPHLTDFDLVYAPDTIRNTRTRAMGKWLYAAPEMMQRPQDADARSDVYSLAMTLAFVYAGDKLNDDVLFEQATYLETLPCEPHVRAALAAALKRRINERVASVADFARALRTPTFDMAGPASLELPADASDDEPSPAQSESPRDDLGALPSVVRVEPTTRMLASQTYHIPRSHDADVSAPRYTYFIAHATADRDRARTLYDLLHPQIPCFLDVVDLTPGDDWATRLRAAQQASLATLALISDQSDAAYYLSDEIHSGIAYQRADPDRHRLVPVYLDGRPAQAEAVPYGLHVKHSLDVRAAGLEAVVADLARLAEHMRDQGAPAAPAPTVRRAGNRLRLYRALCGLADDALDEILFHLGAPQRTTLDAQPPRTVRARNLVQWAEERGSEHCDTLTAAVCQRVPAFRWLDQRRKDLGRVSVPGPDYELSFNASDLVVSLQLQLRATGRAEHHDAQPSAAADVVTVDFRRALRIAAQRPDCMGLAIIGDPGSGKTTLLQQMFCEAHDSGSEAIGLPPGLTPVFVRCKVFKDFGPPAEWSFQRVVEAQAKADGREGASAELWSGEWPLLLLLDGLDEVPTEALREQICAWLMREAVKLRGVWYFVVTSRVATWRRSATLRDELFLAADALSLDEPSIRGYVERWFRAVALRRRTDDGDATPLEQRAAADAKALLDELYSNGRRFQRSLHELMGNPLSLALLCQVHTRHVRIPQRLGDLYDACLNVFLDRRAREEERLFLPTHAARVVLEPLAWRMQDAAEEDMATERVEADVADTLARLQLQDLRGISAREFVRRAWEECGLFRSRDFEKLGFFHAALREYLAACHALKESLLAELAQRADDARWRNVLLLIMSLEGGFSGLVRELLAARRLASHEALLSEGVHSMMRIEPQAFREALQAGAGRGGWRGRLRRLVGAAADGPSQDDLLAILRILEGREIPELREVVEPLVRDARPLVRSAARRYLGHAQGVVSLKRAEPGQVWREPLTGIAFVWIPPGVFLMGFAPGVKVTLTDGFWIGQHPVTNEVYGRFLVAGTHREPEFWRNARFNKPDQPVVGVGFRDALAFGAWATKEAAFDDDHEITLPTEAEWEYVARTAGGDRQLREHPWGHEPPTPERAVFHPAPSTAPVGERPLGATPLGVHDLAGNVWEWCMDPAVPPDSVAPRAVRGGSWFHHPEILRAAIRLRYGPGTRDHDLGFRVVCVGSRQDP